MNNSSDSAVQRSRTEFVYFIVFIGALIWLFLVFLAPLLKSRCGIASGLCYAVFTPVCHQLPSRCFWIAGYPLAVCARCLGIYSGFMLGTCLYPLIRGFSPPVLPGKRIFILVSLPIVADTAANFLSLWMTGDWLRFATGVLWGTILPYYFIPGLADVSNRISPVLKEKEPALFVTISAWKHEEET